MIIIEKEMSGSKFNFGHLLYARCWVWEKRERTVSSGMTQLELECTKLVAVKKKILPACFHICFKYLFYLFTYLVEPVQSK